MLEVEIKALKEEVSSLRESIAELTSALLSGKPVTVNFANGLPTAQTVVEVESPEVEEPVQVSAVEDKAFSVSRDALQELCTGIMRKDRSKKDAIKDIISSYGGASNLRQLKDEDLADAFSKLEAL